MGYWHDEKDSIEQLRDDAREDGHTPDSVRESAVQELRQRGYTSEAIVNIRIRGHEDDAA